VLPFPDLDSQAGKSMELFSESNKVYVDQKAFNDNFGFVATSMSSLNTWSILLFVFFGCSLLAFIVISVVFCTKLRKIDDDDQEALIASDEED